MMRHLLHDRSGASAAEFALVAPLLVLLLFGVVDAGRWLWEFNRAEKATQMGARFAVVADPVSPGIDASYLNVDGLTQGDKIPADEFGEITCVGSGSGATTSASCSCTTTPCPTLGTPDPTAFAGIVQRMQYFLPQISASNVSVIYSSSGLGYAGNPNGADLSPLVTVKLRNLEFTPIASLLLVSLPLPDAATSLTGEDLIGADSN